MTVPQHYSRPTGPVSSRSESTAVILSEVPSAFCSGPRRTTCISKLLLAAISLAVALPALAQYPGQVDPRDAQKDSAKAPILRAVAVLEWTGEPGKPKASRIVPITVYDGQQLQDGGLYLSRPQPLAIAEETEYQLKKNGRTTGLFDVTHSGRVLGAWAGFGEWKPLPKPANTDSAPPKIDDEDDSDDKPVLHRKHPAEADTGKSASSGTPAGDDNGRPTLHKPAQDDSDSKPVSSTDTTPIDPDRPVMKKPKPAPAEVPADAEGNVSSLPGITDPDRPRLMRGKSSGSSAKVEPTLMGLPPDMQQAVAVSDARNLPDHPWTYKWANPDDQDKMKAQLEDIARKELGLAQPSPAPAPAKSTSARRRAAKKAAPSPTEPEPAPIEDEQFRVFELAYGSGATLVLTAHTQGALADEKFVTLIAQPDLYGSALVLFKQVTDGAHLDENPRMRLVDAVDALADNRGELLFELRGLTSRQFALYRVLRGQAEKIFVTFGGNLGVQVTD